MVPGLAEKYTKKGKLQIVKCSCGHEFPSRMLIPKCSECNSYITS